jgi:hypothetical protein
MIRSDDEFGEFLADISDALAEAVLGDGEAGREAPAQEAAREPGPVVGAWLADREKLALDWVGLEDRLLEDPL